jgi:hypothetical protein
VAAKKPIRPVRIAPKNNRRILPVLAVLLVLAVGAGEYFYVWPRFAAHDAAKPATASVDGGPSLPADEATRLQAARLQAQLQEASQGVVCPSGTRRVGSEPPDGHEVWCERTKDGKAVKDGPYEAWHQNGVKSVSGAYVDNERSGPWIMWHDNGERRQECTYLRGKPDGRFREWSATGEPTADVQYKNGKVVP